MAESNDIKIRPIFGIWFKTRTVETWCRYTCTIDGEAYDRFNERARDIIMSHLAPVFSGLKSEQVGELIGEKFVPFIKTEDTSLDYTVICECGHTRADHHPYEKVECCLYYEQDARSGEVAFYCMCRSFQLKGPGEPS